MITESNYREITTLYSLHRINLILYQKVYSDLAMMISDPVNMNTGMKVHELTKLNGLVPLWDRQKKKCCFLCMNCLSKNRVYSLHVWYFDSIHGKASFLNCFFFFLPYQKKRSCILNYNGVIYRVLIGQKASRHILIAWTAFSH